MDTAVKQSSHSSKEKSSSSSSRQHSSGNSNSKNSSSNDSKKKSKHHHRDRSSSEERESLSKRKHENNSDDDAAAADQNKRSSHRDDKSSSKKHRSDEKSRSKSSRTDESPDHNTATSGSAGGDIALSIEETNKLREKLGLKPLSVSENKSTSDPKSADGKKTYIDKDTNQEFEHVPAKNIAELKEQKNLREKLQEQKEKRQLVEKLRKAKGLADSDEEDTDSSAVAWLLKVKQKEEAQKKAKLLEEMDAQLGEDDFEPTVRKSVKPKDLKSNKKYDENDLKGLRVEHDQSLIKEGHEVILTLKDRNILKGTGDYVDLDDDEEADVLVNVNIMDDEKAVKNIENKKKKPDYQAYDDFDEDGVYKERSILDKYNEELNGEKKKSFKLGVRGQYDASDDRFIEKLNQEHKARAIKIDALNELKFATDYMTQQEMEKFKKPKKVRKVLRKNKMMKADDLLATAPEPILPKPKSMKKETNESTNIKKESIEVSDAVANKNKDKKISLKDIDFGFKNDSDDEDGEYKDDDDDEYEDDDDDIDVNKLKENEMNELKQILEDENNTLEELHSVLSKTRKRVTSSILNSNNLVKQETNNEHENESKSSGIVFENLNTIVEYNEDDPKNSLTLDTMSEFCRNLGGTSNATKPVVERPRHTQDDDDDEDEETKMEIERLKSKKSHPSKSNTHHGNNNGNGNNHKKNDDDDESSGEENDEFEKSKSKEMEVDGEEAGDEEVNESGEGFDLLDEEPVIDRGLASCLKLAFNKGYIEQEKSKQNARFNKANIEAVNFTVEEKSYYDIDDKYNRNRDRFSGPLSDFQEKSNYKPDVKLDYIDEKGHAMNEKEAFRYLSHKFHGKGSGKKKTEKQNKKNQRNGSHEQNELNRYASEHGGSSR